MDKTLTELELCQQQAQENLDNWKRERADFVNYKKEEAKRLEDFVKFANLSLLLQIIEIIDDLETAVNHGGNEGSKQILKKFQDLLNQQGLERINTNGRFNPDEHEAISTDATSDASQESIAEVRAGYKMNGRVIRPARVKIIINNN